MTQLHRYGSLGCINLAAVLEPLNFVLPQKETLAQLPALDLDISTEISNLTFDTQRKEPATDPDPTLNWSGSRDTESELVSGLTKTEERDEEFSLE